MLTNIYLSTFVGLSKYLRKDMPSKAEAWHTVSHKQYFLTHCFLTHW